MERNGMCGAARVWNTETCYGAMEKIRILKLWETSSAGERRSGAYARLSRTASANPGIGGKQEAAMLRSICFVSNMEMITTPSGLFENAKRRSRSWGDFKKS